MKRKREREIKSPLIRLTNGVKKVKISCFTKNALRGLIISGVLFTLIGILLLIFDLTKVFKPQNHEIVQPFYLMFFVIASFMFSYFHLGQKAPILIRKYIYLGFYPIREVDKKYLKKAIKNYKLDELSNIDFKVDNIKEDDLINE